MNKKTSTSLVELHSHDDSCRHTRSARRLSTQLTEDWDVGLLPPKASLTPSSTALSIPRPQVYATQSGVHCRPTSICSPMERSHLVIASIP